MCRKRTWLGSFDHLVGAYKERIRDLEADRLRRLQVEDELEDRRRLHWEIGRHSALEDSIDIRCCLSKNVDGVDPVRQQAPTRREEAIWIDRWQAILVS